MVTLDRFDPISFNTEFAAQGANSSGAKGEATFHFLSASADGKKFNFSYDLENISSAPSQNSRIVGFGFNVSGPTFTVSNGAGSIFTGTTSGPQNFNGLGSRDICFYSGNNCNGGGNSGVTVGGAAGVGSFSLTFSTAQSNIVLSDFVARWQAAENNGSTSGMGTVVAVPEASTWAMLLIGFGGIGASVRSRRRKPIACTDRAEASF